MSNYNLKIIQGRDFQWAGTISLNGVSEDITGDDILFYAKRDLADPDDDALFTCSVGDGITRTTPASGQFTLLISAAKTESLIQNNKEPVYLFFELIFAPSDGKKWSILLGKLIIEPRLYSLV